MTSFPKYKHFTVTNLICWIVLKITWYSVQDLAEKVSPDLNFEKFKHSFVKKCEKKLLVPTKSFQSRTEGPALVSNTEKIYMYIHILNCVLDSAWPR